MGTRRSTSVSWKDPIGTAGAVRAVAAPPLRAVARFRLPQLARQLLADFRRHRLNTHATAVGFQLLISLVPLALLGIGLLGLFGLESVWTDTVSPTLHRHLTSSVATAADDTVERIFARDSVGLLLFAVALLVWNTLRGIRGVAHALDEIHEQERLRTPVRDFLVGVPLAVAVDLCVLGALAVFVAAPRLAAGGAGHEALVVARWLAGVALLWLAVGLLIRYAPGQKPEVRWASGGSILIVVGWLAASFAFGFWSSSVADYRSATGTLLAFLLLTAYVLTLSYVFVLGAQLDETLRRRERSS